MEKLFVLCPIGEHQLEMELNIVRAAVSAKVKRLVKLSAMGASRESPIEFARTHGRIEEAIQASGCSWTFIRPNMFMQNLFWYRSALCEGSLPWPLGEASVSHVDGADVAKAAASAPLDDSRAARAYTITGPEPLIGAEAASLLSRVLEKTIAYQPVGNSDFRAYLKSTGESDFVVNAEAELFAYWSDGHGSEATGNLESLTGKKAASLAEFARREKDQLL